MNEITPTDVQGRMRQNVRGWFTVTLSLDQGPSVPARRSPRACTLGMQVCHSFRMCLERPLISLLKQQMVPEA